MSIGGPTWYPPQNLDELFSYIFRDNEIKNEVKKKQFPGIK
jgi:hypothetical protein